MFSLLLLRYEFLSYEIKYISEVKPTNIYYSMNETAL